MNSESKRNRKYWKRVIKEDRWYDYSFLLKIIEHKINHMIINWDKSHYLDSEKDKLKMIEVKNALRLFREDNFFDKYYKEFVNKYGKLEKEWTDTGEENLVELNYSINGKEWTQEVRKEYNKYLQLAEIDKNKCKDFIFDTLKEEIEKWWD